MCPAPSRPLTPLRSRFQGEPAYDAQVYFGVSSAESAAAAPGACAAGVPPRRAPFVCGCRCCLVSSCMSYPVAGRTAPAQPAPPRPDRRDCRSPAPPRHPYHPRHPRHSTAVHRHACGLREISFSEENILGGKDGIIGLLISWGCYVWQHGGSSAVLW